MAWAEFAYNVSYHEGAGTTPFEAVYGRSPPTIPMYLRGSSKLEAIDYELKNRDEILSLLKSNLLSAQQRMKAHADKHRTDVVFAEGDMVFVKLQPYRQASLAGEYHKLSKKYYGPYRISKRIGQVVYVLQLPEGSRIHNTFHVSCLKPAYGSVLPSLELPPRVFHNNPILDPLRILDSMVVLRQGQPIRQILVQWLGTATRRHKLGGFYSF